MRPIFDAHLDIAWSAIGFNRDLLQSVQAVRESEAGLSDEPSRGKNTLTFPELKRANIRVCVATLLVRAGPEHKRKPLSKRTDLDFCSQDLAHAEAHAQLAYYRLMETRGLMRQIRTSAELDGYWQARERGEALPMGFILSMEGADPVTTPREVEYWWQQGLRAIGPTHYGRGVYAYGTHVEGPFSADGITLLKEMQRVGMILDVTHLCDISFFQALDHFSGHVLASHHNCRALVPGDRQLTDEQIKILLQRKAVIGVSLDAWMLYPNWIRGQTQPAVLNLTSVADHIDHVCQLAGSTQHSAIGSDLDGGFGIEQAPHDLDTITDLHKIAGILASRGYKDADIDGIFFGNWLRFFKHALPGN